MNKINGSIVAVFGVIVFLALVIGTSLLGGGWGMMGPGMMGGWGFGPFGWIGTPCGVFMWLIPVGFVVLTGLGIVWLVRVVGSGMNPAGPTHACQGCGRAVQADWKACPYCGVALV